MKKNIYVVTWPDGTISILNSTPRELDMRLDEEGNAYDPRVKINRVVPDENGNFYLTTALVVNKTGETVIKVGTGDGNDSLATHKFPKNFQLTLGASALECS